MQQIQQTQMETEERLMNQGVSVQEAQGGQPATPSLANMTEGEV